VGAALDGEDWLVADCATATDVANMATTTNGYDQNIFIALSDMPSVYGTLGNSR
jgi:hypothetical protein